MSSNFSNEFYWEEFILGKILTFMVALFGIMYVNFETPPWKICQPLEGSCGPGWYKVRGGCRQYKVPANYEVHSESWSDCTT